MCICAFFTGSPSSLSKGSPRNTSESRGARTENAGLLRLTSGICILPSSLGSSRVHQSLQDYGPTAQRGQVSKMLLNVFGFQFPLHHGKCSSGSLLGRLQGAFYGRSRVGPEIAECSLAGPFLPRCILGKGSFRWVLESEARDPPQSHVKGYAIIARRGFSPLAAERPGSCGNRTGPRQLRS